MYTPSGIPLTVLIAYQMMFAIITPALITGAFTNRVTFKAYLIFLVVWQLFVYYPFVHMIWGGGMLPQWGVRDFAGGIVVHATAGWAALASVLYVGRRRFVDTPHNIPFIALGTGLLWFGWYGFNAGSELKVDDITATAFLNTDIAASFAAVTWLFVEWRNARKPHFVGLLTGAVAGLATITPAAGFVPIYASVVIGIVAGPRLLLRRPAQEPTALGRRSRRLGRPRRRRHARDHPARRLRGHRHQPGGAQGLIHGTAVFFGKEVAAGIGARPTPSLFTYVMLSVIDLVTPVRVGEDAERGLDEAMHGENAYDLDEELPSPGSAAPVLKHSPRIGRGGCITVAARCVTPSKRAGCEATRASRWMTRDQNITARRSYRSPKSSGSAHLSASARELCLILPRVQPARRLRRSLPQLGHRWRPEPADGVLMDWVSARVDRLASAIAFLLIVAVAAGYAAGPEAAGAAPGSSGGALAGTWAGVLTGSSGSVRAERIAIV